MWECGMPANSSVCRTQIKVVFCLLYTPYLSIYNECNRLHASQRMFACIACTRNKLNATAWASKWGVVAMVHIARVMRTGIIRRRSAMA